MTPQFDETREEAIAECPACSSQCVAAGVVTTDVDADFDRDGLAYTWAWVEFTPLTLFYQQCGLRLTMQAELAAAGVPKNGTCPILTPLLTLCGIGARTTAELNRLAARPKK
jgi:hypothetical protein